MSGCFGIDRSPVFLAHAQVGFNECLVKIIRNGPFLPLQIIISVIIIIITTIIIIIE